MSTLALAPSSVRGRGRARPAPSLFDAVGREPTLDELLAGVWEGLAAHHSVCCPACGGEMAPVYGGHAPQPHDAAAAPLAASSTAVERAASSSVGGRCRSCDTALS